MSEPRGTVGAVVLDLLMATMDSMRVWAEAVGDRELGLRWRDAVTARMIEAGPYRSYEALVADTAADLGLDTRAPTQLEDAWPRMRAWPDAAILRHAPFRYAFATNCSSRLARVAVERSGLRPAFVLSAEEAEFYKPRQEVYRLACERLGTAPSETFFVAGATYDAAGAAAAGLPTSLVERRPLREPVSSGVRLARSLPEALAGMR